MCSWNKQLPNVIGIGPQWATTNVRQKAIVVCEVRGSQSTKRLLYESRDLEHNALTDWQPVQLHSIALATRGKNESHASKDWTRGSTSAVRCPPFLQLLSSSSSVQYARMQHEQK